jgi:hypothetical protein
LRKGLDVKMWKVFISAVPHVIARASYFSEVPLWKGTVLDERKRDAQAGPAMPMPVSRPPDR